MIVSDTSPLRYLIAVRQANLIEKVFRKVSIPPAVCEELTHRSAPTEVQEWLKSPPPWLKISEIRVAPPRELLRLLDRGEGEAIQLAIETQTEFILMDERLGRSAAGAAGLTVIGALGLLRESYRQRFLSNPLEVLDQMKAAGFRLSQALYREFQAEIARMKSR
jgi:predicted nucleic acid-binding protein